MVTLARPERLTLPLPALAAGAGGGLVALVFLLMPAGLLEGAVLRSGIPAVLAAAEPPLGFTARIALALLFGGLVAGFAWFGAGLLANGKSVPLDALLARFRRGDVHPDGPPRPPLFANRDLGTPFMGITTESASALPVEQSLPTDLNQPLAAFDPDAMLAVPLPPPEPVAPLKRPQLIDPGDRFETFELTPMQRPAMPAVEPAPEKAPPPRPLSLRVPPPNSLRATPLREAEPAAAPALHPPVVGPQTESTVQALLARLEQGLAARERRPAPLPIRQGGLQDTLGDLRKLAAATR
jgi:hypothetical protein